MNKIVSRKIFIICIHCSATRQLSYTQAYTRIHTHTHTRERSKMLNLVTVGRCSPRLTASEIQTKGAGPTKTLLLVRQYVVHYS